VWWHVRAPPTWCNPDLRADPPRSADRSSPTGEQHRLLRRHDGFGFLFLSAASCFLTQYTITGYDASATCRRRRKAATRGRGHLASISTRPSAAGSVASTFLLPCRTKDGVTNEVAPCVVIFNRRCPFELGSTVLLISTPASSSARSPA
jgi:hypothetical protein